MNGSDTEAYPVNYALEAALHLLHDRNVDQHMDCRLDASDLLITEELIGRGAMGVVKAGQLKFGGTTMQVNNLPTM